jgi:hypothetical protein
LPQRQFFPENITKTHFRNTKIIKPIPFHFFFEHSQKCWHSKSKTKPPLRTNSNPILANSIHSFPSPKLLFWLYEWGRGERTACGLDCYWPSRPLLPIDFIQGEEGGIGPSPFREFGAGGRFLGPGFGWICWAGPCRHPLILPSHQN